MIKEFFKTILYEPFFNLLVFFAYLVPGHSIGWAIVLLTLFVKLLLWAPSMKALRTPLQLRQYQDDIRRLQEQHKDDKTAQAQALMQFYRTKNINPLSGCLTLLIQLPVIIILYRVFVTGLQDLRPDLLYSFTPHVETLNTLFYGVNLAQPDKFWMPLLAAAAQFAQSWHYNKLNPPAITNKSNDPAAMMMKQMMYLFPVMTFVIGRTLPAGLSLYWAASTLFSWAQQVYLVKTFKPEKPKATVTVRSKSKKKK